MGQRNPNSWPSWQRAFTLCEQCPDFPWLVVLIRTSKRKSLSQIANYLLRSESTQQDAGISYKEAMLRGKAHKRKCVLCSTILKAAAGTGLTFKSFRSFPM